MWDQLLAYGMGPGKLCNTLNGEGYKISLEESRALFDAYKREFRVTIQWLYEQNKAAQKQLWMQNPQGRKRHWVEPKYVVEFAKAKAELAKELKVSEPDSGAIRNRAKENINGKLSAIGREGANFLIQSTNADWTKVSMYEIRKACKQKGYDARMYNSVYDEIVLDVKKSCAEEVYALQSKIMIECGQRFTKKVPVEVEGHLKEHWTK